VELWTVSKLTAIRTCQDLQNQNARPPCEFNNAMKTWKVSFFVWCSRRIEIGLVFHIFGTRILSDDTDEKIIRPSSSSFFSVTSIHQRVISCHITFTPAAILSTVVNPLWSCEDFLKASAAIAFSFKRRMLEIKKQFLTSSLKNVYPETLGCPRCKPREVLYSLEVSSHLYDVIHTWNSLKMVSTWSPKWYF
jgi:acetone carboxylase gamma subunit